MQKRDGNVIDIPLGAGQLAFLAIIGLFSVGIVAFAQDLMFLSRIFPITVGSIGIVCTVALFYQMLRKTVGPNPARYDEELIGEPDPDKSSPESQLLWFIVIMAIAYVVGFFLAIGIFIAAFLKLRTRLSALRIAAMAGAGLAVLAIMGHVLHLDYPRGLLQYWFHLPWPLS